jgi:hypothetical protein
VSARLRRYCQHAELALCLFLFKGSHTLFMFLTPTVNATTLFCCSMHQLRARGRVKDLSSVGLSIRHSIGSSVALPGSLCAQKPCQVYHWFHIEYNLGWTVYTGSNVEAQVDWIFWLVRILEVEGIYWVKRSLQVEIGSFSLELVSKSSSQVGTYF